MKNVDNIKVVDAIVLVSDNSDKETLIENYPYLILNENQNQSVTKKNVVAELKKYFPKIKFSVRKEYFDCYGVSWFESVTIEEVDNVLRKFIDHENDITGDFRDPNPSNFNSVFGGLKYISTYRNFGECKSFLLNELGELLGDTNKNYPNNVSDLLYRLMRKTTFPIGATVKGIEQKKDFQGGLIEDSFSIIFN